MHPGCGPVVTGAEAAFTDSQDQGVSLELVDHGHLDVLSGFEGLPESPNASGLTGSALDFLVRGLSTSAPAAFVLEQSSPSAESEPLPVARRYSGSRPLRRTQRQQSFEVPGATGSDKARERNKRAQRTFRLRQKVQTCAWHPSNGKAGHPKIDWGPSHIAGQGTISGGCIDVCVCSHC